MGIKTFRAGLIAVLGAMLAMPAQAKEGDTFRPFVSYGTFFDSNLFRLADNESPGTPRDDRYSVLSAGLNVDWKPGRQEIVANATKTRVRYNRNTMFDSDGNDYQATWNWRLGNRLSGNAGASESLSQSNFDSVGLVNNQVTRKRRFGRAEWAFHPRWRIGGGDRDGGLRQQRVVAGLAGCPDTGAGRRPELLHAQGQPPAGAGAQDRCRISQSPILELLFFGFCLEVADNSYKQTEYNLLGDWSVSGKLKLHGQAGWVNRQYENVLKGNYLFVPQLKERPDFSGFAGRMSADWYATGKTLLSVSAVSGTRRRVGHQCQFGAEKRRERERRVADARKMAPECGGDLREPRFQRRPGDNTIAT